MEAMDIWAANTAGLGMLMDIIMVVIIGGLIIFLLDAVTKK